MHVIVIASQKGGVGKTTLAGHLGVAAEAAGAGPVALIDTDPQGSLSAWWNSRAAPAPLFAQVEIGALSRRLAELRRHGVRLVIIDTPPALTASIGAAMKAADLVVIPTRPSPHDLRAVGATVEMAQAAGKPIAFVVNGAAQRARITADAAVSLSQHGAVAPVILHQRVDFAVSMIDGRTAQELDPASGSAREVGALWSYLEQRLSKAAQENRHGQGASSPA